MNRVRNLGVVLVFLATDLAPAIARAQAQTVPLLDDVTLARRGNAVLAAKVAHAEPPADVLEVDLPDRVHSFSRRSKTLR